MNEMAWPASIGEILEKTRAGILPDFRTWSGSEAERAMNAEAEDYLASVGIDSRGKRYSSVDVLHVKRRDMACAECGREGGNIAGCRARGYKTLPREENGWINTASAPCGLRAAVERQEAAERLIGALPSKLRAKSFENFRTEDVSESVRNAFFKTREAAKAGGVARARRERRRGENAFGRGSFDSRDTVRQAGVLQERPVPDEPSAFFWAEGRLSGSSGRRCQV
jgi:hypothetical protein